MRVAENRNSAHAIETRPPSSTERSTRYSDTLRGELSSKKKIRVAMGTAKLPTTISAGSSFPFGKNISIRKNPANTPAVPASSRTNIQGLGQPGSSSLPQNLPFKLCEYRQKSGHGSTGRRGQIQRLSQRHEPDSQMLQFLKRCQQVRD